MSTLTYQRCFNHVDREAVARCPGCTRYFCRECVTEHDDRVLCTACLAKLTKANVAKIKSLRKITRVVQFGLGVILVWFFFFAIGETLQRIPDEFHEGNLWQTP